MTYALIATMLATFAVAVGLTRLAIKRELTRGVLDLPNDRSSHTIPTPRGGGIAVVATTTAAIGLLALLSEIPADIAVAVSGGGLAVALVGYLDDRYTLSAQVRLPVHFAASLWALTWLGGVPPLQIGDQLIVLGWSGYVLGSLSIVWVLNLFNFMDGIDGIAASEAIFVAFAGAMLAVLSGPSVVAIAALVFAAACAGFLAWNWPPAKIFMGDVGSGYIGYIIAVLVVAAARENASAPLVWLLLGSIFFVDATVTLLRRLSRGERVYEAHRSHAYQNLARRWGSHLRVTLAVLAINVACLLPCAVGAVLYPEYAPCILLSALLLLTLLALLAGAGRRENQL